MFFTQKQYLVFVHIYKSFGGFWKICGKLLIFIENKSIIKLYLLSEGLTMHNKFLNKASAAIMSAAMLINGMAVMNTGNAFAAETKYEFEDAKISGEVSVEENADASGGKILKMENTGSIEMNIDVEKDGIYNIMIYCGGIGGAKQQNLKINGVSQGVLAIPESDGLEAVKIPSVKLNAGENTILIEKSWGWSNFDYMTVEEAVLAPITASQTTPCDPDATAETKNLMSYLASVYGNNIISGQQEIYMYGPHDFEYEFEYLKEKTGHYPAIRGFDFLNSANILYGSEDGTTDRMIDWVKNKNGIVTASWHITVPKKMEGYKVGDTNITWGDATYDPKETDFVTSNVLKEGTVEREYYLKALEALAGQIQKLQDANVPLIFRPLHEAEGGGGETGSWFWWGKEGSKVYKELWKLTYDTLVNEYGLHNIIWEWNSYNFDTSENWYPGDEYVDIIGYDKYNCTVYLEENNWQPSLVHNDSAISSTFYGIMEKYSSKKMVAMAENDSFSTVDNLTNEKAGWLYFCTWYDGGSDNINFLSSPTFNTLEDTIEMYQSDYCITLDELPEDLYSSQSKPTETTTTSGSSTTTSTTTTTATTDSTSTTTTTATTSGEDDKVLGDANIDGEVTIADAVLIMQAISNADEYQISEKGQDLADVYNRGDGITNNDALVIQMVVADLIPTEKLPVYTDDILN